MQYCGIDWTRFRFWQHRRIATNRYMSNAAHGYVFQLKQLLRLSPAQSRKDLCPSGVDDYWDRFCVAIWRNKRRKPR